MNVGLALRGWPTEQVVKCLLALHPDDPAPLLQQQLASVLALQQACHATGHELLLELIPPRDLPAAPTRCRARWSAFTPPASAPTGGSWCRRRMRRPGRPSPTSSAAHDAHCRGVLLLGLEASEDVLAQGFRAAAGEPLCKGFAVGRSIFGDAANAWMAGQLDDAGVVADVATRYQRLITLWLQSRQQRPPAQLRRKHTHEQDHRIHRPGHDGPRHGEEPAGQGLRPALHGAPQPRQPGRPAGGRRGGMRQPRRTGARLRGGDHLRHRLAAGRADRARRRRPACGGGAGAAGHRHLHGRAGVERSGCARPSPRAA